MSDQKELTPETKLNRRKLITYGAPVAAAGAMLGTLAPAAHANTTHPNSGGGGLTSAMWLHGTEVAIENPENLAYTIRRGWGTDVGVQPGKGSWFHFALPTPVIAYGVRTQLLRVFMMFASSPGEGYITNLHVYDGAYVIQQFNNLAYAGEHRGGLDGYNTFNLPQAHTVLYGIGISFHYQASVCIDGGCGPSLLRIATAGGDYA